MSVFPYRPEIGQAAQIYVPGSTPDVVRSSPMEWARRRKVDRETRRMQAAESRAVTRLGSLGSDWHVVEWPHSVPLTRDTMNSETFRKDTPPTHAGFLAIGPGGIYSISVADHGRSRVLVAGDVVQVGSKRPTYIAQARKDAKRAGKALSAAVGQDLKVVAVLAFVGNGLISVYGLPKDCLITTYRELDKLLGAAGSRITAGTAEKLAAVARSPWIWANQPYRTDAGYSRPQLGSAAGDKGYPPE
jgi:hypothetical protein